MTRLSRGDLPARRLALNVLGRFGEPQWPFRDEIVARLLEMWDEDAGDAASDLVAALGHHCEDARVREKLLSVVGHPDFGVRWHVTHAFGSDGAPDSTAALIQLSADADEAIRDWATFAFALGNNYEPYTPAVRAALIARLNDTDPTTRLEAINGLAERGDAVVLGAVLREFEPDENGEILFDKVESESGDRVLSALEKMRDDLESNDETANKLRQAIAACQNYPPK